MQKARRRPKASTACRHTVSGSFSLPCSGFFSPFLHSTRSLSVSEEYLALPDGPGRFRQGFTCPALLRILLSSKQLSCTGLSPISLCFPSHSTNSLLKSCSPTTPQLPKQPWFGLIPVRSPLLRKSLLFSFPAPTQMFQFSAFASFTDTIPSVQWVSPFGNLGINSYLPIPLAYRSLSRPSSPLRAKASPVCPL